MNLFEAGVVPGVPAGAIIGAVACKSHGALAAIGGAVGGLVAGGLVGWLFAFAVICLMSVFGVLWMAALRRPHAPPTESDHAIMTRTAKPGIVLAMLAAAVLWATTSWLLVGLFFLIVAPLLALIVVAAAYG